MIKAGISDVYSVFECVKRRRALRAKIYAIQIGKQLEKEKREREEKQMEDYEIRWNKLYVIQQGVPFEINPNLELIPSNQNDIITEEELKKEESDSI